MYPDFNRGNVDTDDAQQYFAVTSAFPNGIKVEIADKRPEANHKPAYSHGGSNNTIYAMLYTFYEDIKDYQMAGLEYQRLEVAREIEQTELRIKQMDEALTIMSDTVAGGVESSATTAAGTAISF